MTRVVGTFGLALASLLISPTAAQGQIFGTTTTTSSTTSTTVEPQTSTSSSSTSSTSTTARSSTSLTTSTTTEADTTTTFTIPPTPPTQPEAAPDPRIGSAQMSVIFPMISLLGFAVAIGLATRQWLTTRERDG